VKLGDSLLAIRLDNGATAAFPFVDRGYGNGVAECSTKAYLDLGGTFGRRPEGQLYKSDTPELRFLYLAFPKGRKPSAVLAQIAKLDNSNAFPVLLAFIVKATATVKYGQVNTNPVWEYEQWKKLPDERRYNPDIMDFGDLIDVGLRDNGFSP
jgi:hypothetical protein